MLYKNALRPILFSQDPEAAHERAIQILTAAARLPGVVNCPPFTHSSLKVQIAGIDFPNPVGLAAGCDKNGKAVRIWPKFGFGFVEIGTITAQPQPGNPRPRVFRLPELGALVNRLGFNSEGSEKVANRIARLRSESHPLTVPLGINIGKTKLVSGDDETIADYRTSFRHLAKMADFVVINISSPNTPGLRQWQERSKLSALLSMLKEEALAAASSSKCSEIPLFVKISPDMGDEDTQDVAETVLELQLAGIIATNTTVSREGVAAGVEITGGLSGRPLREKSTSMIREIYRHTKGKIPIIGVGGVFSASDAYEKILAGASLVQIYTGLVFEGPGLPRLVNEGLIKLMQRDGFRHISEVVGKSN